MMKCGKCGKENEIVNQCGCDPNNLPTKIKAYKHDRNGREIFVGDTVKFKSRRGVETYIVDYDGCIPFIGVSLMLDRINSKNLEIIEVTA